LHLVSQIPETTFKTYNKWMLENAEVSLAILLNIFLTVPKFCNHEIGKLVMSTRLHTKYGLNSNIYTGKHRRLAMKCTNIGRAPHGRFFKVRRRYKALLGSSFHHTLQKTSIRTGENGNAASKEDLYNPLNQSVPRLL